MIGFLASLALSGLLGWTLAKRIALPLGPVTPTKAARLVARAVTVVLVVFFVEPLLLGGSFTILDAVGVNFEVD